MNPLALVRSRLVAILLAGVGIADLAALSGCVYPVESEVFVGPPPVLGPSLNVGVYGTPAGYYYRNNPVFIYRGRPRLLLRGKALLLSSRQSLLLSTRLSLLLLNDKQSPLTYKHPYKTMSLFDTVLASMNDPSRATQKSDLESLLTSFGGGGVLLAKRRPNRRPDRRLPEAHASGATGSWRSAGR